jgi:hypothetical protein
VELPEGVELVERGDRAAVDAPLAAAGGGDDEHFLAGAQTVGAGPADARVGVAGNLDRRQPAEEILRDDLSAQARLVEQRHLDGVGPQHDVVHGEDDAARIDQGAGAHALAAEDLRRRMRGRDRHAQADAARQHRLE